MKYFIGIDLGSTNVKAGIYNADDFTCLLNASMPVVYDRNFGVEIELQKFEDGFFVMLKKLITDERIKSEQIAGIGLTGQAETLVILDKNGHALMNAISWMDERSRDECEELKKQITQEECERVTGQKAILPTWPATKILWLKKNRPEIFEKAAHYMLLKDYLVYRLTGHMMADCSIATFSFCFDIYQKCYWKKMLDVIGIQEEQLPVLVEPCTVAGNVTKEIAELTNLPETTVVNVGTLDHFAGMIGTGNIEPGIVSLSTGTVMALATLAPKPEVSQRCEIAMHYGFMPDTYVILPVAESGGVSLEWFKNTCMSQMDYDTLNQKLSQRAYDTELLFLPYLVGTNAPEFDTKAKGMFYGLRAEHDAVDMAKAVMEGVAFLLRKNCDAIRDAGVDVACIYATGGGTRSKIWCQIQANITGLPVIVLKEKEIACLGAAVAAAVKEGNVFSYQNAAERVHAGSIRYEPHKNNRMEKKYKKFCALYQFMVQLEEQ